MRWMILVLLLALFVPTAAAREDVGSSGHSVDVDVPGRGCDDCVAVTASAWQSPPKNCADCPGYVFTAGAAYDDGSAEVTLKHCRSGFFYWCPIDRTIAV